MTAPDPGLTDLIAADLNSHTWGNEYENAAHEEHSFDGGCKICRRAIGAIADRVALVVEQHTNGRIAELYEQRDNAIEAGLAAIDRAEKAEATIARVEKLAHDMRGWCSPHGISVTYSDRILEVLEWTELAAVGITRVD
ncbi:MULTISPECIES: hypothetical protein [Rhodococcus]|uniref:hypothetical protein n=1 Tax=Rhodococcus TaxID=1827 RepID=UPI0007AEE130|nr:MULTISPECIES: hypothetical protein [Rhodococcus]KZL33178.1 hypothetical protein A3852_12845 [Rhodococcus qingshengii]MCE4161664.1 hypothetical protein [Rhodococcus sp. Ni2]